MKSIKIKNLFVIITVLLSISCNNTNNQADAYGNFETNEIIISAEQPGKILLLPIDEGELIKKGDTIAIIDTLQLFYTIKQLKANRNTIASKVQNILSQIDVQEETKKNLLIEKNRTEKLLAGGAAPTKTLDDINGKLNVLESQIKLIRTQNASVLNEIEALDAQILSARDKLTKCIICSPRNCTLLEKYAEQGEIATLGKPICKIADLSIMYLRFYISGIQLAKLKIGNPVRIFIDNDEKTNKELNGIVTWISPQAEFTPKIIQTKEERVKLVYAAKAKIINTGELKIGMPGEVIFEKNK